MLEIYKKLIANQYEAALCMLEACVDNCPDSNWNAPVANLKYCQAMFHTLFFTDVYLGADWESQRQQKFHLDHASTFADYEELEDRPQQALYEKSFIKAYLQHCRDKVTTVLAVETAETLAERTVFKQRIRAELHVINIRHIHHHAAQLGLRLRLDTGAGIPWVGSGWK